MTTVKLLVIGKCDSLIQDNSGKYEIVGHLKQPVETLFSERELLSEIRTQLSRKEINAMVLDEEIALKHVQFSEKLQKTGLPVLRTVERMQPEKKRVSHFVKRFIDICFSLVGIILVGMVSVIIYPIVNKQSPGNLIFTQDRVGKNGKPFKMFKFRSMYLDAEERKKDLMEKNEISSDLMFKLENDPRIFPFGQKMRDWSIDELPQFINVLKGEMSLIGTRPPTIDEYSRYELHHFKRLVVKPGITGMWQVSGRSNIKDFEQVVALDSEYIDNWSLWLDLKIILKTIKVVLTKEGSK